MTTLGSQTGARRGNNFNVLRLLLALMVIFSHSFPVALGLGGDTWYEPIFQWTRHQESSGGVAVHLFFLISGFLVTASWQRSSSLLDYLLKRIRRIYPGFICALVFSATLAWTVSPGFRSAGGHPANWGWLWLQDLACLTTNSLCQAGLFAGNPLAGLANASMWTIVGEFLCYLGVLIVGFFGGFQKPRVFLIAALLGYEIYALSVFKFAGRWDESLACFLTGAVFWLWRDRIPLSNWLAGGGLAVLVVASQFPPWLQLVFPILAGYCTLWLAYGPKWILSEWADKTDLSYGTYLYAFPVQQMLAMHPALRRPGLIFICAVPITLGFAWLSWNLVEKRFLAMKNRAPAPDQPAASGGT